METKKLEQWAEFGRWSAVIFGLSCIVGGIESDTVVIIRSVLILYGVLLLYAGFNY